MEAMSLAGNIMLKVVELFFISWNYIPKWYPQASRHGGHEGWDPRLLARLGRSTRTCQERDE
jgi:hypothetical protein